MSYGSFTLYTMGELLTFEDHNMSWHGCVSALNGENLGRVLKLFQENNNASTSKTGCR